MTSSEVSALVARQRALRRAQRPVEGTAPLPPAMREVVVERPTVKVLTVERPVVIERPVLHVREVPVKTETVREVPRGPITVQMDVKPLGELFAALHERIAGLEARIAELGTRRVRRRIVRDADGYITHSVEEPLE